MVGQTESGGVAGRRSEVVVGGKGNIKTAPRKKSNQVPFALDAREGNGKMIVPIGRVPGKREAHWAGGGPGVRCGAIVREPVKQPRC